MKNVLLGLVLFVMAVVGVTAFKPGLVEPFFPGIRSFYPMLSVLNPSLKMRGDGGAAPQPARPVAQQGQGRPQNANSGEPDQAQPPMAAAPQAGYEAPQTPAGQYGTAPNPAYQGQVGYTSSGVVPTVIGPRGSAPSGAQAASFESESPAPSGPAPLRIPSRRRR